MLKQRLLRRLALAAAGLIAAALLLTDRPGLAVEYFALEPFWEGEPVYRAIAEPQLDGVGGVLISDEFFSVSWRGWLNAPESGEYVFQLGTEGAAYLDLDGDEVLQVIATPGRRRGRVAVELERGPHAIEVRLHQAGRSRVRLDTAWTPPGAAAAELLPRDRLHARRPTALERLARAAVGGLSLPYRRVLGSLLLLAALALLARPARPLAPRLRRPGRRLAEALASLARRRALHAALLLVVVVAAWWMTWPYTTQTVDGDDVRYMEAAVFDLENTGYLNRYAHVYLLEACRRLAGGDVFLGSRGLWSLIFVLSALALGLGTFWMNPRAGWPAPAVALFLFLSQTSILGNVGATFPDFTAMMFVTLGVAVYLHQRRASARRGSPDWHALALGALTLAAFKSKETGLILAWVAPLMLWVDGRPDLARFARRLAWWLVGAAAALVALMVVDAWTLGDFWFAVRPENLRQVRSVNFAAEVLASRRSASGWLHLIFQAGADLRPADLVSRNLWLLALIAPFAAAVRGRRLDLRLLHLMPLAYAALMMLAHVRATYIFSFRYLLPIVPVCCLLAAQLWPSSEPESPSHRRWAEPRIVVPLWLVLTILVFVWMPYRAGSVSAAELLPGEALAALVWTPAALLESTVAPLGLLLLVSAAALVWRWSPARPAVLLVALVVFFGTGLAANRAVLVRHISAQRGELTLYPWQAFRETLEEDRPTEIVFSPDLYKRYRMIGQPVNREPLARVFFGREDLELRPSEVLGSEVGHALASRRAFELWKQADPALERRAIADRSGQVILIRPASAAGGR